MKKLTRFIKIYWFLFTLQFGKLKFYRTKNKNIIFLSDFAVETIKKTHPYVSQKMLFRLDLVMGFVTVYITSAKEEYIKKIKEKNKDVFTMTREGIRTLKSDKESVINTLNTMRSSFEVFDEAPLVLASVPTQYLFIIGVMLYPLIEQEMDSTKNFNADIALALCGQHSLYNTLTLNKTISIIEQEITSLGAKEALVQIKNEKPRESIQDVIENLFNTIKNG